MDAEEKLGSAEIEKIIDEGRHTSTDTQTIR
jgi:hypothetical protein